MRKLWLSPQFGFANQFKTYVCLKSLEKWTNKKKLPFKSTRKLTLLAQLLTIIFIFISEFDQTCMQQGKPYLTT